MEQSSSATLRVPFREYIHVPSVKRPVLSPARIPGVGTRQPGCMHRFQTCQFASVVVLLTLAGPSGARPPIFDLIDMACAYTHCRCVNWRKKKFSLTRMPTLDPEGRGFAFLLGGYNVGACSPKSLFFGSTGMCTSTLHLRGHSRVRLKCWQDSTYIPRGVAGRC